MNGSMRKSPGQPGSICRACILGAEILAGRTGFRGRLALFVLIGLLNIPAPRALSEDSPIRYGPASKSLQRTREPVILESEKLEGLFDGETFESVALYAYGHDGFRSIPFQIDPIGADGLVIPGYVNRVRKKAVYDFIPNPDRPEHFTGRYQVLFMARDTGDRCAEETLPAGFSKGLEIEVRDPLDGGMGWVYLLKPEGAPPAGTCPDYVDYRLIHENGGLSEQIRAKRYITGFPDADKPFAYGCWVIPEDAGGSGVNLLQTFRVRVKIRILFVNLDLDPKSAIVPYVLGYSDGPVRVSRRVYSSIVFKGIPMDRLMGEARLEAESHYYSNFFTFDGEVSLPGFVKKISKVNAMFTTDFTSEAVGLTWYNSANPGPDGCVVDGILSPQEQTLEQDPYLWSLLVGREGGWANILRMRSESIRSGMKLFYLDDNLLVDEKEPRLHGTWASTGYRMDRLDKTEEKLTFRTYIFAISRDFKPEDATGLIRLVYDPLEVGVSRVWDSGKEKG